MTINPQAIPFPKETSDYIIKNSKHGLGLFANRNIKKGKAIFRDSIEFTFTDVEEGDYLLLEPHNMADSIPSTTDDIERLPHRIPLTKDILTRSHGVPNLYPDPTGESAGIVSWHLEIPVMLMNHSSNPNTTQTSNCTATGEDIAVRNIKKGEELTCNYNLQYYDHGPFFDQCNCGSANCLGHMKGFKSLSNEEKEKSLPLATEAVQAMYKFDVGEGLPLKHEQVKPTQRERAADFDKVPRLVFPGPSHALAKVAVRQQDDSEELGLYAMKDFKFGEKVYWFWCREWPLGGKKPIDMVFAMPHLEGDPEEGTVVRLKSYQSAHQNRDGKWMFSGWDLLTAHSCDPNLMYRHTASEEEEDWRAAYAAKDIKAGDRLTVDYNSNIWDRSEDGADNANTNSKEEAKGFKFLSVEAQEALKMLSWRRVLPPYDGEAGMALSLHIRDQIGLSSSVDHDSSSSSESE